MPLDWDRPVCQGDPPAARSGHSLTIVGRRAFLFGGCGTTKDGSAPTNFDKLYSLDLTNYSWSSIEAGTNSPSGRRRHTANAIPESKILLFGGESKLEHSFETKRLNDCWLLEIGTDEISWKIVSFPAAEIGNENTMPHPRCHHTAVIFNQNAWLFGGYGGSTVNARTCLGDLWALDLQSFRFTCPHTHGVNPKPRAGHTASLVEGSIMLVAAGRDHSGSLDDVHLLNLETLSWSLLSCQSSPTCMPSRVYNHLAAAVESVPSSKLFVFGGQTQDKERMSWTYIDQVSMLDVGTRAWTRFGRAGRRPAAREEAAWAYDSKTARLVLFGGWADEWLSDVLILDVAGIVGPPYGAHSIDPPGGPMAGGTRFVLRGVGFPEGREVLVRFADGQYEATVAGVRAGPTEVFGAAPVWDGPPGPVEVRVSFGGEGFTVNRVRWEYFASARPERCVAFGPGLQPAGIRWGTPAEFRIVARDGAGRRRASGRDPLVVAVRRLDTADGVGAQVDVRVADRGDGAYDCCYIPPRRGRYLVSVGLVELAGLSGGPVVQINGSPWTVEAAVDPWTQARTLGSAHAPAVEGSSQLPLVLGVNGRQLLAWRADSDGSTNEEEREEGDGGGVSGVLRVFDAAALRWDAPELRGDGPTGGSGALLVLDDRSAVAIGGTSQSQLQLGVVGSVLGNEGEAACCKFLHREQIAWQWEEGSLKYPTGGPPLPHGLGVIMCHCLMASLTGSKAIVVAENEGGPSEFQIFALSGGPCVTCVRLGSLPPIKESCNDGAGDEPVPQPEGRWNDRPLCRCGIVSVRKDEVVLFYGDVSSPKKLDFVLVGAYGPGDTMKWRIQLVTGDVPTCRIGFILAGFEGQVVLYGGVGPNRCSLDDVYVLDPVRWNWVCVYCSDGDWMRTRNKFGLLDRNRLLLLTTSQNGDRNEEAVHIDCAERYDMVLSLEYKQNLERGSLLLGVESMVVQITAELNAFVNRTQLILNPNLIIQLKEEAKLKDELVLDVLRVLYDIRLRGSEIQNKIDIISEAITFLNPDDSESDLDSRRLSLNRIRDHKEQVTHAFLIVKDLVKPLREVTRHKMLIVVNEFAQQVFTYSIEFEKKPFFRYHHGAEDSFWVVSGTLKEINSFEDRATDIYAITKVLEMTELDSTREVLSGLKQQLRELKQLWDFVQLFESYTKLWLETPLACCNAKEIHQTSLSLLQFLESRKKEKVSDVYCGIHSQLSSFISTMSLVSKLLEDCIQDRHWELVKGLLNLSDLPYSEASFQLKDLMRCNFIPFASDITNILHQAQQEEKMISTLNTIHEYWTSIDFLFEERIQNVQFARLSSDSVVTLEEHQFLINSLLWSRYLESDLYTNERETFQLRTDVMKWNSKLKLIAFVVLLLDKVQTLWSKLSPAFAVSGEIYRELDEEASRFQNLDMKFKSLLLEIWDIRNVEMCSCKHGICSELEDLHSRLEIAQKSLAMFTHRKRKKFPRFYFMSTEDLVSILCNSESPLYVVALIHRISLAVKSVKLVKKDDEADSFAAVGWDSVIGFEQVEMSRPLLLEGPSEMFLADILTSMSLTLRQLLRQSLNEHSMKSAKTIDWASSSIQQIMQVQGHIFFNREIESALRLGHDGLHVLNEIVRHKLGIVNECSQLLGSTLGQGERMKVASWIVQDSHFIDLIGKIHEEGRADCEIFLWKSQLRFYWKEDVNDCFVSILHYDVKYEYEYLGNGSRVVITPLTERIFCSASQTLMACLASNFVGPPGCGKTESVTEFARVLGKCLFTLDLTFCYDYPSIDRVLTGLGTSGCWLLLDNVHQLQPAVISFMMVQCQSVMQALSSKKMSFNLSGEDLVVNMTGALFATSIPGHEVKFEISSNLKSFLRPCYVMYPEISTICRGMLCAAGFTESKILSMKLDYFISVADNMFCASSLSWGIQTMKSILERAAPLLIAYPGERECCLIGQSLLEFVLPRVNETFSSWLLNIVSDVFGVETRIAFSASEPFVNAFHDACAILGLKTEEALFSAAIQWHNLMGFRHSIFVLGKAGTGKSSLWKIIAKIQEILIGQFVGVCDIFPKILTLQEFYGGINSDSEWRDGLLTKTVRFLTCQCSHPQWLVLDGIVSHDWIELMQTMISESKSLLLPNGETFVMDQRTYLIFEAADLKHASPSSLSNSGVIHVQDTALWMLAKSRLAIIQGKEVGFSTLFDHYIPQTISFMQKEFCNIVPFNELNMIETLILLFESVVDYVHGVYIPPQEQGHKEITELLTESLEICFVFACVWAFGSSLGMKDGVDKKRSFSNWWKSKWTRIKFPAKGTVFDYTIDQKGLNFVQWCASPTKTQLIGGWGGKMYTNTPEMIAYLRLLGLLLQKQSPVSLLLVGNSGCGKSSVLRVIAKEISSSHQILPITFHHFTESSIMQKKIEDNLEKKAGNNYGPCLLPKLIVCIEDVNLPRSDAYGSQSSIELLRQHLDYKHWYGRKEFELKNISSVQYVATVSQKSWTIPTDPRLLRHFSIFVIDVPGIEASCTIFRSVFRNNLNTSGLKHIQSNDSFCNKIVTATVELRHKLETQIKRRGKQFRCAFNLDYITQTFDSIMKLVKENPAFFDKEDVFTELWIHESECMYLDKLSCASDVDTFKKAFKDLLKRYFKGNDQVMKDQEKIIFSHISAGFQCTAYQRTVSVETLIQTTKEYLDDYNNTNAMMDLFIFEGFVMKICRITRMLHMGNGVVVGPQACGKMTLIRLSAFIMKYNTVSLGCSTQNCKRILHNDIQQILLRTVLKDERIVMIISSDIVRAGDVFTEIHDLLLVDEESNCFVTEFFGTDGAESVYTALKRDLESSETSRTQRACYSLFFTRLCKNLRMVQAFSDLDAFSTCVSRFPIVMKDKNIVFFQEWDRTVLESIAKQCITKFDFSTELTRDISNPFTAQFLSYSFLQAVRFAKDFRLHKSDLILASFKSFLISLSTYQKILNSESKSLQDELLRYDVGLDRLKSILHNISILEENLARRASEIEEKKHAADFLVDSISNDQASVHEQVEKLQIEASKCDQLEMRCALQEQDCLRVLTEAEPAILAAEMALNTIDKKDIVELKSLPNPPSGVEDVTAAILALRGELGKNRDWNSAKHMMRDPAAFILELKGLKPAIDEGKMSAAVIESSRQYLALEHFNAAVMLQKSKAVGGLCDFVINLISYYDIMVSVQPRRKAVDLAKEELISAANTKASLSEKIQELRSRISELEEEYMRVAEAKHVAIREAEKLQKQVTLAQRFITALKFEQNTWSDMASRLRTRQQTMSLGILISTAFVSYAGTFSPEMRNKYLNDCLFPYMETNTSQSLSSSILCNPTVFFSNLLETDPAVINDLSRDETFLENILITRFSVRYPLLIDPHLSGVNWIRSNEKNSPLKIELLTSPTLKTSLLNAVQFGWSILVEGVDNDIVDRDFLNLISKRQFKKDSNFVYYVGDKACEHHPAFNLFMLSQQKHPHFSSKIQSECTVIDFSLSNQGIENRILEFVINIEQIKMIKERFDALNTHRLLLATKKEIDDAVLKQLSESSDDIIHDIHQIHFFENSRISYAEALGDIEDVRDSLDNIMKSTEIYRSVAQRATIMFLLLREMRRINEFYQFSLDSFMNILLQSVGERQVRFATPKMHVPELLKSTLKSPYHRFRTVAMTLKACIKGEISLGQGMKGQLSLGYNMKTTTVECRNSEMLGAIMKHLHDFSCVALQERHRLLFSSILMFRMLLYEKRISSLEFSILTTKIEIGSVPEMPTTVLSFLSGHAWASAFNLQNIPALSSLTADLEMNADRWNIWYNSNNSESLDMPGKFKNISRTQKYLVVLALRPDRVVPFLKEWISDEFGSWFLAHRPYSTHELLQKCSPSKPIIFLLNPCLEFNARLLELSCGGKHVIEYSLGPSLDSTVINALHKAVQTDSWVLIRNLHHARPNLFSLLSYIADESAPKHSGFLCVFTAAADEKLHAQFPLKFIECCLKSSINPPMGMKACLISEWKNFQTMDSESSARVMHTAGANLLFALSVFHSFLHTTNRFVSPNAKDILHTTWFGMKKLMMFTEPSLCVLSFVKDSTYALAAMDRVVETLYCSFNIDIWGKRKCVELLWQLLEESHDVRLPALRTQRLKSIPTSYLMFVYEVERLWFEESATELGLGPNSEWHALTTECMTLLGHISSINTHHPLPNADTPTKDILTDILNQLPANINLTELRAKVLGSLHPWDGDHTPFGFVLIHECSRMNELLNEIRSSAVSLNQMLDGEVWANESVNSLMSAIDASMVPQQWSMFDFPTLKGLGPWFVELLERVERLLFWADHGTRARSIWISGLFCPALQFTATLQVEARKQNLSPENFFIQGKITGYEWDTVITAFNDDDTLHGVFVHGMFLDGARWDSIGVCLAEQRPKERYPKLPIMHIQSTLKHEVNDEDDLQAIPASNSYDCPVYRTCTRESNLAFSVPLDSGLSLKKWITSEVCLLLSV